MFQWLVYAFLVLHEEDKGSLLKFIIIVAGQLSKAFSALEFLINRQGNEFFMQQI